MSNSAAAPAAPNAVSPRRFVDVTSAYADRIRMLLTKPEHSAGLTGRELAQHGGMSEGIVRRALDRMLFLGEVAVELKHTPGKRGAASHVFTLAAPKQ